MSEQAVGARRLPRALTPFRHPPTAGWPSR